MKTRKLGRTDIDVSLIGLGTMTWGEQNSEQEAHEQIDYALSQGVNLIDTAEMYPVPPQASTQGKTEEYIGTWLAKTGRRQDIVLATKAAGPARMPHQPRHIRDGDTWLDRKNLTAALDASLARLKTDYVDLYQMHWPDRTVNIFGRLSYPWVEDSSVVPIEETLSVLADFVKAGKVRHVGVSNETPWGLAQYLKAADSLGLPRIVSVQNPYSLLNRLYEGGLSEFSHREGVGLLAYSPLAFGTLTGKYLNGARPQGSRLTSVYRTFNRYDSESASRAIAAYVQLAKDYGYTPAQLALGFVARQPFVSSVLTGQTSEAQLQDNFNALDIEFTPTLLDKIAEIHRATPNPAP